MCVGWLQLQAAFGSRDAAWAGRFGGVPAQKPTRDHVLVFVGDSDDVMRAGAGAAAAAGFQRTAILQGDLAAFSSSAHTQVGAFSMSLSRMQSSITSETVALFLGLAQVASGLRKYALGNGSNRYYTENRMGLIRWTHGDLVALQANLRYINRDALAVLLGLAGSASPAAPPSAVLDIRRYDERTLYGSIPGTKHIPGALQSVLTTVAVARDAGTAVEDALPVLHAGLHVSR